MHWCIITFVCSPLIQHSTAWPHVCFLCSWYVAFRALTEDGRRTVIYASASKEEIYIIPPAGRGRVRRLELASLQDIVVIQGLGEDVLVVADSVVPPELPYPTLVISSPGRLSNPAYTDLLKQYNPSRLYMPIPTESEIWALRAAAFSFLDEAGVKLRLQLWGPIPRDVLVDVSAQGQAGLWASAQGVKLEAMIAMARNLACPAEGADAASGALADAPHRVFHERAAGQDAEPGSAAADKSNEEYYARGLIKAATPTMLRHVVETIRRESKWSAGFSVDSSIGMGELGARRGFRFEDIALDIIKEGCRLECMPRADCSRRRRR